MLIFSIVIFVILTKGITAGIINPRANSAELRARVLIPSRNLPQGKVEHQQSLKFINDRGRW
jgi:hypothetical protein